MFVQIHYSKWDSLWLFLLLHNYKGFISSLIEIKNCANIQTGTIAIEHNKINLKFGHNGIGKTTILRSLEMSISSSSKESELTPYNSNLVPTVNGTEQFKNTIVFNEDYIKQFLFDSTDLLKNSHELIVTTSPKFKETEEEIDRLLREMKLAILNNEELSRQIAELEKFENSIKENKDGTLSKSCQFMKGFMGGNKLSNIPDESETYGDLISDSNWVVWFKNGSTYKEKLGNKICPYCGVNLDKASLHRIHVTESNYEKNQISSLNASLRTISEIKPLMEESDAQGISEVIATPNTLSRDQQIYIAGLKRDASVLIKKLKQIRDVDYHFFKKMNLNNLETELKELVLQPNLYKSFDSGLLRSIAKSINQEIDKVILNISDLKSRIGVHNASIKSTVEKYENDINQFIDYAGFKYFVKMVEINNVYNLVLYPNGSSDGLKNVTTHLSYGERNVFAIALFLYQAIDEKYDLVMLDDPISSFDKNKKFAILHKLFKGELSLNNKTVVLATHDFDTVIDLCYVKKGRYNVNAKYLSNDNGTLKEKDILKEDIKSFTRIAKENIESSTEIIVKLIYARRLLDITRHSSETEELVWNYISSVLHLKLNPDIQGNDGIQQTVMSQKEMETCEEYILNKLGIEISSYQETISLLTDKYLLEVYNTTESNYTKLQIYRTIIHSMGIEAPKEKSRESIFNKFINETYHPENDYVFDLNPISFERVPDYIIEKCDRFIETIHFTESV